LRSEAAGVETGAHVRGLLCTSVLSQLSLLIFPPYSTLTPVAPVHQEYIIVPNLQAAMLEVIERDPKLDWSVYIGAAGMPGESAYVGWRAYSDGKPVSLSENST
jgi:NADPH-dependent curcumin reductase CurA